MAFFPINKNSKFGGQLTFDATHLGQVRTSVDLHVARVTEMTDAQVQSEYGTTLTRTAMLTTLTQAQTALANASITALITQIG